MKKKIIIIALLLILLIGGVSGIFLYSHRDSDQTIAIPVSAMQMFDNADFEIDTICVVDGRAYYYARDVFSRVYLIFDKNKVYVSAPSLNLEQCGDSKVKYYLTSLEKKVPVDFSDIKTVERLAYLSQTLQGFKRFRKESEADFGNSVNYNIAVDFPLPSAIHSDIIAKWIVSVISNSLSAEEDIPQPNAIYVGYHKNSDAGWTYTGDIHNYEEIGKWASGIYFAKTKKEWGNDNERYPYGLYFTLNIQARILNDRIVTLQQCTDQYNGGAHGFYTERLVSFDHVHNKEIDFNYLFKPECEEEVYKLLQEEAKDKNKFGVWIPQVSDYVIDKDEDGNMTGGFNFPQPGISEEGIVFSFQPYAINCFAAGIFHFVIPFDKIKHCLTDRGKWCLGIN